ncbi:hypothetical protein [Salinisphaera shabanensis]|jgi:alkyl sulfatase BDS1-like metallo-beta-lactamase superfamily hydrolase|uniref:hypothetical protein n=1 Tax=Salinisphaera shabanensis TaxID=180542 RepID=UPI00333E221B
MNQNTRAAALIALFLGAGLAGYGAVVEAGQTATPTPASTATQQANATTAQNLPLDDQADFKDAERGLIARDPNLVITDADGNTVWDMTAYDFIEGDAPDTVNPSLWRQADRRRHLYA